VVHAAKAGEVRVRSIASAVNHTDLEIPARETLVAAGGESKVGKVGARIRAFQYRKKSSSKLIRGSCVTSSNLA
jgi:hypothetical protein